jgi:uncharacterized damage-inducible protein DinB
MPDPNAEALIQSFAVNLQVIHLQTEGLTHQDSLLQPPFRGNCLNWVLGHIMAGRNICLKLLGEPPLWMEAQESHYRRGSEPIVSDEQAYPLDELLRHLDQSQQQLSAVLTEMSSEALAAIVPFRGGQRPLAEALSGQHWHETYHVGQLELLRQLAGTDDAII